jgi:hypothetical protein
MFRRADDPVYTGSREDEWRFIIMSISKKWRGIAAGLFLSVAALGTVAAATPSQAADVRFGIVLTDHDRRPPVRYERVPEPSRYYARADWRPGHWEWRAHQWEWSRGDFARHDYRDYGHRW